MALTHCLAKTSANTNEQRPVAIVTGAGQRLGLFMTKSLLASGWHVIALTRGQNKPSPSRELHEAEHLAEIISPQLDCISWDMLSAASVAETITALVARYPRIDLLLHNASIFEKDADTTWPMPLYESLFRIHMKVPAYLNQACAPALAQSHRPTGNIIHISDIYAANPNPDYALYCSTKAGAENLMLSHAKRFAPQVRVNAIQPGPIKFLPTHTAAEQEQVLNETLLAVEGGFEALEQAIYSILGNEYMTAAVVRVDGGRLLSR